VYLKREDIRKNVFPLSFKSIQAKTGEYPIRLTDARAGRPYGGFHLENKE
jgi:hypothetical protein